MKVKTSKTIIMICLLVISTISFPDLMYWVTSTLGWICILFFIQYYATYGTFDIFAREDTNDKKD